MTKLEHTSTQTLRMLTWESTEHKSKYYVCQQEIDNTQQFSIKRVALTVVIV